MRVDRIAEHCVAAAVAVVSILTATLSDAAPAAPRRGAVATAAPQVLALPVEAGAALVGATYARLLGGAGDDSLAFARANLDLSIDLVGTFDSEGAAERGWIVRLDAAGTVLAQKLVGSSALKVLEIATAGDGGFFVLATPTAPGVSGPRVVAKLTAGFAVTWQKTVGDAAAHYDDLVPLADGGLLLTGPIYSNQTFSSSHMITKLASDGTVLWRKDYPYAGVSQASVRELADGTLAVIGSLKTDGINVDAWIIKLDAAGVRQWDARLDRGGGESFSSLAQLPGGVLVACGVVDVPGTAYTDLWLVRFGAAGAVTAQKVIGGPYWDQGAAFVGSDGKLYLSGASHSVGPGAYDGWLAELDPTTLAPLWSKAIGGPLDDFLTFVPDSTGGGFLGGGTSRSSGGGKYDVAAVKLASGAGSIVWQRLFGAGDDEAGGVVRLPEGSVLLTGDSASFAPVPLAALAAGPQDDALVVKLLADGVFGAGCGRQHDGTLTVSDFAPTVTTTTAVPVTVAPAAANVVEVSGAAALPIADSAATPRDACTAPEVLVAVADADTTSGPAPLLIGFTGSAANGTPPYTYSWNFDDGSAPSASMSPIHTFVDQGTYQVILTVTDAAAATATDTVTIQATGPQCSLQCAATVTTGGFTGSPVSFASTATATSCAEAPSFQWEFGDGGTSSSQSPSHTYATVGTYAWSLEVEADGQVCSQDGTILVFGVGEITVLLGAVPITDGQAGTIDFGTVGQGNPGPTRIFTVRNDGTGSLNVGLITLPSGFTVVDGLPSSLAAGQSETLTVRLDSAIQGVKSGQLQILNGDSDESPFNFPIVGTVGPPSAPPRRFDFGTATSPVAAGYLRVSHTTTYAGAQSYGWTSGVIQSRDRAAGGDLHRDLAFTPLGTFEVDVPNGVWDVTVTLGDATAAHDRMGVLIEGAGVDDITTRVNEFVTRSYRVTVVDGRVTVTLDDLGAADPNVVINALALAEPVAGGMFDFGTASSPVEAGYTRVEPGSSYSASAGFGWLSGTLNARDRATGTDLERDFVFTPLATFAVDLPPGIWDVAVTLGDVTTTHDQMGVYLEGELAAEVSSQAGHFTETLTRVTITDGQLTVLLDDHGGTDGNVAICGLKISPAAADRFDFGTPTSPVGWGFARVTDATAYAPGQGYGWKSGAVGSRDRGTGTDVTRDLVFTPLAEFAVDMPPGRYDVTLVLGDATTAHEQMGVNLEGNQVDSITTAVNQFVTRTYRVAVNDGQLLLKLDDLGGTDANVVINALEVVPAAILKLDFGTASSPVAADYVRVTDATAYAAVSGYGWVSGTRQARDRATADPLTRDFVFSALATFAADLPRGSHNVTVRLGDATAAHEQMGVYFEGALFESVTAAAGQVAVRTTNIEVTDGQLTLLLDDLGGGDANAVINALEIR